MRRLFHQGVVQPIGSPVPGKRIKFAMPKTSLFMAEQGTQWGAAIQDKEAAIQNDNPIVSVVMPCLNEEKAVGTCIETIQQTFAAADINGEIIVCDNDSTDNSVALAESLGARVVHQPLRGYGNAYLKGFASARGKYLIMGDADGTYDFTLIPKFLGLLKNGFDFVTGSRYLDGGDEHIAPLYGHLKQFFCLLSSEYEGDAL